MNEQSTPTLRLILPRLADDELAAVIAWGCHVEQRYGASMAVFGDWLGQTIAAELRRRTGDGETEAGSVSLPALSPAELGMCLIAITAKTYGDQSARVGEFFDDLMKHLVALSAVRLCEFQALCQQLNERAKNGN